MPASPRRLALAALLLAAAAAAVAADPAPAPLLRFPDVHGDTVVFVRGDDIWAVPAGGGLARRLTDHEGLERQPRLSPDGSLIAFTGEVDGNPDVYVMDADGGDVRRLTFHPDLDEVVGWHPTRNAVLFRSRRASFNRFDRLFLIGPDGRGLEELPLHQAGRGAISPDGGRIAYNRVAIEDRTWKRYRGGLAPDLWLYDLATGRDRRLTDGSGAEHLPIWVGDRVYFVSDEDGVSNLWSLDPATGERAQVTHHRDLDVLRPSGDGARIAYELGGDLWLLDTATGATRPIPVQLPTDDRERRPYLTSVADLVTSVDCAPKGGRALVVARGDVFTVPREHGPTRALTASSGARERDAVWSPDGSKVAYLSDASGEYQVYVQDAVGGSPPVRLTELGPGFRHSLSWSPDGSHLAFADHTLALELLDLASRSVVQVDRAEREPMDAGFDAKPIADYAWSPDGKWIAYAKIDPDLVSRLYLYSLETGQRHRVSEGLYNDFGPAFSRDGEHLLFVSNRHFEPTLCDLEWEMVYKRMAGVYALTLRRDGPPLLPLLSDEVASAAPERERGGGRGQEQAGEAGAAEPVRVDLDGLAGRVEALPLPGGNYRELAAGDGEVYYLDADSGDFNRFDFREPPKRRLAAFSLAERETRTLLEGVDACALSADGAHLACRQADGVVVLAVGEAGEGRSAPPVTLDLGGLRATVDPPAEWRQVFDEVWRLERDFYYEPGMNGLDWPAVRAKYLPLLERAASARDVEHVVGELIGELATSHTYVTGGRGHREAEEVSVGLLGADWVADEAAGRYRLGRVLRVADWNGGVAPPLAGPGHEVREGDYLLAVNGREVTTEREVFAAFQDLAGEQVRLTFSHGPTRQGAFDVVTVPLRSERTLRYLDWVERNRRRVDQASGGKIGYIHLPDTYLGSAVELGRSFYGQTEKQGLVVDGRFNGGGLDPEIFLHRLARRPLAYWTRRHSADQVTPLWATRAHMVCLTNHEAGSGGDELPYQFRLLGLGPVIGTRTWGGLVGVSMSVPLVDGGSVTAPDYRIYTIDGRWVVENEGVAPDIEVELDPAEMARGRDAQLEKGVEVLLEAIAREPLVAPAHPPFPRQDAPAP